MSGMQALTSSLSGRGLKVRTKKVAWQSKRHTNGAALALGQPPRARCPHVPRARTRRPCGQRASGTPLHARESTRAQFFAACSWRAQATGQEP